MFVPIFGAKSPLLPLVFNLRRRVDDAWPFKSKLGSWEVRRRDRDDIWGEEERERPRDRGWLLLRK